ncbi:MAG: GNAT family N-acetyltransferase [Bacteroidales bacterium]|nr:GNAT family N-acetyltransferase [Bacteroidales bacterium]
MNVEIKKVEKNSELRKFITFPEKLYKNHPLWVPALLSDELNTLKKTKNPAFEFCEADYFLAYRGKEIVGRVAAIINHKANKDWNEVTVRFGWIDFIDDYEVSKALIDTVVKWGKAKGATRIKGPLGFSDMDKEGLMVDGFDKIQSITCIYNYPYYVVHLERLGFVKDIDWTQQILDVPELSPDTLKYAEMVEKRYGFKIFKAKNNKELEDKGNEIFNVLNDAWNGSSLYEFTRLSEAQIKSYVKQYLPMVNKDFICLVMNKEDKIIGFSICVPSLSYAMRKAKGRLFPFGFIHLLRALKKNDLLEAYMIGTLPEYQGKGVAVLIFKHIHENAIKYGMKRMITNPQMETNRKVQSLWDNYEHEHYVRRRSYTKGI